MNLKRNQEMTMKRKLEYKWKRSPKNAPKANEAGDYLFNLKKKHKALTPLLLVNDAKNKKSPLHNCFEWDNTKAAGEYRLVQAREIIRFLVIEITPDKSKPVYCRAIISPQELDCPETDSYMTIEEVLSDPDLSDAYDRQLLKKLISVKCTIKNFGNLKTQKRFAKVVKEIDAVKI